MRTVDSIFQLTDYSMEQIKNTALNVLREAQSDRENLGWLLGSKKIRLHINSVRRPPPKNQGFLRTNSEQILQPFQPPGFRGWELTGFLVPEGLQSTHLF